MFSLLTVGSFLLLLIASSSPVAYACSSGQFGADCSCTSDVQTMLSTIGSSIPASCSGGTWSLTGTLTWGSGPYNYVWNLGTDTIKVSGDILMTDGSSTIVWTLNSLGKSALITVGNQLTLSGNLQSLLVNFDQTQNPAYINVQTATWLNQDYSNALSYVPSLLPALANTWQVSSSSDFYAFHATNKQIQLNLIPGASAVPIQPPPAMIGTLTVGAFVGILIGCLIFMALVSVGIYFLVRRMKASSGSSASSSSDAKSSNYFQMGKSGIQYR